MDFIATTKCLTPQNATYTHKEYEGKIIVRGTWEEVENFIDNLPNNNTDSTKCNCSNDMPQNYTGCPIHDVTKY